MARSLVVAACLLAALAGSRAEAYPLLQLDIQNGTYETDSETIVANSLSFTLYAYLTPSPGTSAWQLSQLLNETYYVSAAMAPKVPQPGADLGTFSFNNTTIAATSDMVYGNPPLESYLGGTAERDSGDLAKHDIYDTYFKEFSFKFNPLNRAVAYDTALATGSGPTLSSSGGMYFMAFTVNTAALNPAYQIHFDMYSEVIKRGGDLDVKYFAPFSHDAQSMLLPEPGSLFLLGTGFAALASGHLRRRAAKKPRAPR